MVPTTWAPNQTSGRPRNSHLLLLEEDGGFTLKPSGSHQERIVSLEEITNLFNMKLKELLSAPCRWYLPLYVV